MWVQVPPSRPALAGRHPFRHHDRLAPEASSALSASGSGRHLLTIPLLVDGAHTTALPAYRSPTLMRF